MAGRHLVEPGPGDAELALMVRAALRAPDHARLAPFRFVWVRGAARARLAALFEQAARTAGKDDAAARLDAERALAPPLTAALVARIDADRPDVPPHEQWIAVGAALANFVHAAHLLGYASKMLSGAKARDAAVRAAFCAPGETLVGWVAMGTAARAPQPAADRAPEAFSGDWESAEASLEGSSATLPR